MGKVCHKQNKHVFNGLMCLVIHAKRSKQYFTNYPSFYPSFSTARFIEGEGSQHMGARCADPGEADWCPAH